MNDFENLFAAISEEADTVILNRSSDIRGRADRRTRIQVTAVCAAVVLAVVGTASSARMVLAGDDRTQVNPAASQSAEDVSPTPAQSATTTPTTSASPSAPAPKAAPATIPDSAFLQLNDVNGIKDPYSVHNAEILPPLCGATYPIDSTAKARQTMHLIVDLASPGQLQNPNSFDQTITTYDGDGATAFMAQLRAAVTACPTQVTHGFTDHINLLSGTPRGDESLLFEVRTPNRDNEGNPRAGDSALLTSVVRVGPVVMILDDQGWEGGGASRAVVDRFTQTAVSRVNAWLG